MKKTIIFGVGLLLLSVLTVLVLWPRRAPDNTATFVLLAPSSTPLLTPLAMPAVSAVPIKSALANSGAQPVAGGGRAETLSRFRGWSEGYAKAGVGERAAKLKEGRALALGRRELMSELIEKNPAEALRQAVPYEIRKTLPAEILALLEAPVNGRGDYMVQRLYPLPGQVLERSTMRQVTMDGQSYEAYVYGARNLQPAGRGVVIWGVALDGKLAVAESPLRILGQEESKDVAQAGKVPADPVCSVSAKPAVSEKQETLADFGGQIIAFCKPAHANSYAKVLAKNAAHDGYAALGGGGSGWTAAQPSNTQGTKTLLYLRLVFPDDPIEPISEEAAYQDLDDLNNFFVKSSYHMFGIYGTVTPTLMMPYPKKWYEIPAPTPPLVTASTPPHVFDLYPQAQAAAAALGYNFSDYDWTCIRFSQIKGANWGGLAGGGVWLQSSGYGVMAHEFGHILGLSHANYWDTSISGKDGTAVPPPGAPVETTSAIGHETTFGAGKSIEYADMFSAMGASAAYPYNMRQKWRLGWMFEDSVQLFDSATNSTVRLYSMDADTVVAGKKYAIEVRRSGDREYWLQYRTGVPGNTYLTNGVQVLWSGNAQTINGETDILDTTPNSPAGRADSPLAVGRTFHDPAINLFMTPTGVGGISSNSYIDVVVNIGTFPTNLPPSFVSLGSDSNNINPGDTVIFTASVTDPNLDPLAYSWTFDDNGVAPSTNLVSHRFAAVGEYVVRCVASDMKGGTASKSMVITVGAPNTYRIGGFIRTSGFSPVADVRVDNGRTGVDYRYGFTDSDGSYVIAGNPNGTYTVGAWKPGQHIEPFNTTIPITIADDHDFLVNWTATATTAVWINGIVNATEGGNATVTLKRSGPLDKDLPVLFRTPFDNTITVNTATVGSDFTQTNGVAVKRTNALFTAATELSMDFRQITFPVFVDTLDLTFPTAADGAFEGPEVFYVDLVDEIQRYFIYNYIDPVLGLKTATNDLRIPYWWQNFQPTFNLPPGNPNNNPSYLSFLPTNTWVQVDPGYVIGRPTMDWPATTIFDANAQALPTLSVAATGNVATESGNGPGEYTFTVSQVLTNALTVYYTMSGTASNGQDYVFMPGTFVIPAGVRSYRLPLFAINDYFVEGPETAILTISPKPIYVVGGSPATVRIVDDDLPAVSIFSLDKTATENGGVATFSFTRTGDLTLPLTVNYLVSGTAISGVDYNTLPGSVTIPAGLTTATVSLVPIQDALVEGDETVVITTTDSVLYDIAYPNVVTLTIQDDELPTVIVTGSGSVTEGANGQFTVSRTGATTSSLKVFYTVAGSAVPGVGADYNSIGTSVIIPVGASSANVIVTTRNDGFFEDTETVVMSLAANTNYNLGTPNTATISILDNNGSSNGAVGFLAASTSASESVTSISLPVYLTKLPTQLSFPSAASVPNGTPAILKVDYGVSGGNAANGVDFVLTSGTLIWTNILQTDPGLKAIQSDLIQNISFTVNNDLLVNGNRSFVVTLSNHLENVFVGPTHQYFSRAVAAGNAEDAGFNIGFGPNRNVNSLLILPSDDLIVGGTFDLINLTNAVRVGHIKTSGLFDGLVETNSFFFLGANSNVLAIARQTNGANAGKYIIGGLFTNTITAIGPPSVTNTTYKRVARLNADGSLDTSFAPIVVDFDVRAIAVDANDNIYIGGGFTNVTTVNGGTHRGITRLLPNGGIDLTMTNLVGTDAVVRTILIRTNGSDLIVFGGDFGTYNTSNATRIVQIHFDGSLDNTFSPIAVAGARANGSIFGLAHAPSSLGANSTLVVGAFTTLNDIAANRIGVLTASGGYHFGFNTTGNKAGTDGTINSVAVQSTGHVVIGGAFNNIGDTATANFSVNAPNLVRLTANGTYNASMPTFPDNRIPSAAVNVVKVDSLDRIYFGGDFLPTVTAYPNNYAFDIYRNHIYTIQDDDAAIINITSNPGTNPLAQSSAIEGGQNGAFVIFNNAVTAVPLAVNFSVSGSAARGADYVLKTNGVLLTSRTVTIPAGTNQVVVVVEPIDDAVEEFTETVTMSLTSVPAGHFGAASSATVTIADNDGSLQFEFATFTAREDIGVMPITLRRSGSDTNSLVTVDYLISNGTAINGVDYFGTNGSVTFYPGQLTTNFNITIVNNNLVDGNRTVNLVLANPTGGVPLGGQNTATMVIVDEDTIFQFAVTNFVTTELSTNGVVTIYRQGQLTNTDSVVFTATNGTASHGVDFTGVTNTVSFAPGVTKQTVMVPILDNLNITGDHTVSLRLQNPSGTTSLGVLNTATLTIRDDESQLTFATNQYFVVEHAGVVTLTVNRVGGTINPVSIKYNTLNGTALAGADYFTNSGTLTFAGDLIGTATNDSGLVVLIPGETSKTFTVTLIDDQIGEIDETFTANLSAPSGGVVGSTTRGSNPSSTVTIVDDEQPGDVVYEYAVGGGASARVVALGRQSDGKVVIGGEFTTVNGTSFNRVARLQTNGLVDGSFLIGAGANSNVTALAVRSDDKIYVAGAFTTFNLTNRAGIARLNADGTLDTTFSPGTGASDVVRSLLVLANGQLIIGGDFTNYNGVPVSRLARLNTDGTRDPFFTATANDSVHSLALQTDGRIVVAGAFTNLNGINVNRIARLNANGTLDASFGGAGTEAAIFSVALQTDGKVVLGGAFKFADGMARNYLARLQSNGTNDPSFNPGTGANTNVNSVAVDTNGKILIGGDFTIFDGASHNYLARLRSNGQVDGFFDVGTGPNAAVRAILMQSNTSLVIAGDFTSVNGVARNRVALIHGDEVTNISTMEFAGASFVFDESAVNATISFVRYGATTTASSFTFFTTDGSAVDTINYSAVNTPVTFPIGARTATALVPLINDGSPNSPRTVNLYMTNAVGGFLDTLTNATLTLNDNDVQFSFAAAGGVTATEGQGTVTIGILRSGSTNRAVSVYFSTVNGSASAPTDFTAQANTLVSFAVGQTSNSVSLAIVNDNLVEITKTAGLSLGDTGANVGLNVILPSNVALTILDDDSTLQLATTSATVSESVGSVTFEVTRIGSTNNTVTARYSTFNQTALAGTDFAGASSSVLTFNPGVTNRFITIPILNNKTPEADETFLVTLISAGGGAILGTDTTAQVTIVDDDSSFTVANASVAEAGGSVTLTVTRGFASPGGTNNTATVNVTTADGTALAGTHYTTTSTLLTFGPGVLTQPFTVPIINNTFTNANRAFTVNLAIASGEASLGSPSSATVTILDDDSALQLNLGAVSVLEGSGAVSLNVTRTGNLLNTVSVPYSFVNGSALNGTDYRGTNGTLVFGPNVTSLVIVPDLINNTVPQTNRSFTVSLGVPVGEASLIGNTSATVTILDDDSELKFAAASIIVMETSGSLPVVITRTGYTSNSVSVTLSSLDITAISGVHYTAVNSNLVFAAGETSKTINVPIIDNPSTEGTGTFRMDLSNAVGEAFVGLPAGVVVTVLAVNDVPTLAALSSFTINEDAGLQTVNLSGITSGPTGEGAQFLTVTATSSNPGLIANPITVAYNSPETNGTLSFIPVTNAFGTATIKVVVKDNGTILNGGIDAVTNTFVVIVNSVNDAPTLTSVTPLIINEDSGLQAVILTGISPGPANESAQRLTITAATDNPGLMSAPVIGYTNGNSTGRLTFTLVTNQSGTANIKVIITDDGGTANGGVNALTNTFLVTVNPVDDRPTLNPIASLTILEDAGLQSVNLSGITAGGDGGALTVTATSDNPGLIPDPTVVYTNANTTGTLMFTPTTNANGVATIMVVVNDHGGVANGGIETVTNYFTVTVTPVNDLPTLDPVPAQTVDEDAGPKVITLTGISAGAANESGQVLSVTAITSNNRNLIPDPTISYTAGANTATLTYTPQTNQFGVATITVTVKDDGGTTNGGVDLLIQSFTVTVNPLNDAPTLNLITSLTINEDAGLQTISLSGITVGPTNEASQVLTVTASSDNTALIPHPTVGYASPQGVGYLKFTPVTNASGLATITVVVTDNGGTASGGVDAVTNTFVVTVMAVNDAPVVDRLPSLTISEDSGPQVVNLAGLAAGPANEFSQLFTVSATSSNPGLIPTPTVNHTGTNATGTLVFMPAANANGTVIISVIVTDNGGISNGGRDTSTNTFTVTVNSINDAPSLNTLTNLVINENAGMQTVNLTGISAGPADEANQSLLITASSSNPSLIRDPFVSYLSPQSVGSLSFIPVAGVNGTATIMVVVTDNGQSGNPLTNDFKSVTNSFSVTIISSNNPPTLNPLPNLTINEDSGSVTNFLFGISAGPADEGAQFLTITATSSDPSVVPHPTVTYFPPQATGSLSFTPTLNGNGTVTIKVVVTDNGQSGNPLTDDFKSVTNSFTVTVNPINDAPTLALISDPAPILEDAGEQTINLTGISVGPTNELGQALTITATSSDPAVIPNPTVTYTSPDGTGILQYTPVANANGTAKIRVVVRDNGGTANGGIDAVTNTFVVVVTAVNDAPRLNALANLTLNEDPGVQTVGLSGISAGAANESGQSLTITATSSDSAVIAAPTITYTNGNTSGSLAFAPVLNASGTATIMVVVTDNGQSGDPLTNDFKSVTNSFSVTINSLNDAPTLTALPDVTINEDAGLQAVNLTGITAGPADETGQTLSVTATSSNPGLIPNPSVTYTSPNGSGTLQYTPVTNANGTATITVVVTDNGGTANGGVGAVTNTFVVVVTAVNDAPTLNALTNLTVNEDPGLQTVVLSGISAGPANEIGQVLAVAATSSDPGVVPHPTVSYSSPNGTGSLSFTPVLNASGTATITVVVTDNGGVANGGVNSVTKTFLVTVNSLNDAPTLAALSNLTINEDAGSQTIALTGIGTGATNEVQTVTITATSSTPSLIPDPVITYTSPNTTGTLTFTPVTNGNGVATITVTVKDNGGVANGGSDTTTRLFLVTINPVNDAPVLTAIGNKVINQGSLLIYTNTAVDVDGDALSYSLVAGPAGAQVGTNGVFTWTPVAVQALGTNTVTVRVTDSGTNHLSDVKSFTVVVNPTNTLPLLNQPTITVGGDYQFTLTGEAGRTYRVEYSTNLSNWVLLYTVVNPDGAIQIVDPSAGINSLRFYRIVRVP